ncbi:MAG: AraC family transcriptional regulator [Planctomycetota bacterium]
MQPFLEQIEPSRRQSFTWRRMRFNHFRFGWHVHPEAELTTIVRGRGTRYVGDHVADYREGDLVLLAPNLPHTWSSPIDRPNGVESVVIQFLTGFPGEGFLDRPELGAVRRLLQRARVGLRFTGRSASRVADEMGQMETMKPLARMLRLWELLDRLASSKRVEPLSTRPFTHALREADARRIDRVCRAIEGRFAEPIALADGAQIVHLHPSSFARWFKQTTGQTFVEYLHRLRVGHAARRLIESDAPVTDICFESGFGNLSHFHRVFRRLKGTTPSAYRRSFADPPG